MTRAAYSRRARPGTRDLFPVGRGYSLLCELRLAGVEVFERAGEVFAKPSSLLTPTQRGELRTYRREILSLLPYMLTPTQLREAERRWAGMKAAPSDCLLCGTPHSYETPCPTRD